MEALALGMTFIEFKELIRPEFDKAFSKSTEAGDIPEGTTREDILQVENSDVIPEDYSGLVFNKKTNDIVTVAADSDPPPVEEVDGPVETTEINMLPDAALVENVPFPTSGTRQEKQAWNKKYNRQRDRTGLYDRDTGSAIVVPRRPTTEAEKEILINDFEFERVKKNFAGGTSGGGGEKTLSEIQTEWDEKYGKSHDPSGYPLGYTLKTN